MMIILTYDNDEGGAAERQGHLNVGERCGYYLVFNIYRASNSKLVSNEFLKSEGGEWDPHIVVVCNKEWG